MHFIHSIFDFQTASLIYLSRVFQYYHRKNQWYVEFSSLLFEISNEIFRLFSEIGLRIQWITWDSKYIFISNKTSNTSTVLMKFLFVYFVLMNNNSSEIETVLFAPDFSKHDLRKDSVY